MASPGASSELAALAVQEFSHYFEHLAGRVEQAVRAVPTESLWIKPFPFGNSIGHLVTHITGNLNHYIGAQIAGTGYVRNREQEFTSSTHPETEQLLADFRQAVMMVIQAISTLDVEGFRTPVDSNAGIRSRLGLLLTCASHMNNHIGQMSYLISALKLSTDQVPAG